MNANIEENPGARVLDQWGYTPSFSPARQEYAVLSIVDGGADAKKDLAIKIYGCFGTLEQAQQHATRISKECDAFDVFTLETSQWARLPPEVESLENVHYTQSRLEEIKHRAAGSRDAAAQKLRDRILEDSKAKTESSTSETAPMQTD